MTQSDVDQVALDSMNHVGRELTQAVEIARKHLESYVERGESLEPLGECAAMLGQIRGVLSVVELYGASLLAEEMERVTRFIVDSGSAPRADALEVLSRALLQLPLYVERVIAGARDIPYVLLPLLNDLRTVRGEPLLNENTLFLLNMSHAELPPEALERKPEAHSLQTRARELRPRFQASLLGWITGTEQRDHIKVLLAISIEFEEAASETSVHRLWRVASALLEALRDNGLEPGAAIKRLLGQVDRQIKRLIDEGETAMAAAPPDDLVNNMLYYVGRARASGHRVRDVKRAFDLERLLPDPDKVVRERDGLAGPSPDLMRTVGAAIKDDLSQVKDGLDIFLRTGGKDPGTLQSQRDLLAKIGDTLGMLGLGRLRREVDLENARLARMMNGVEPADENGLMSIAGILLRLEDRLDKALLALIEPGREPGSADQASQEDADFRAVTGAVIRECLVNLARVKEAIVSFVAHPENTGVLEDVAGQMRGIRSAMLIIERDRVSDLVERLGDYIQHYIRFSGKPPGSAQVERVADAIVSLEYYLETIKAGRADPWYMLDNAEACMQALRRIDQLPDFEVPDEDTASVTRIYEDGDETVAHVKTTQIGIPATRVVRPRGERPEVFTPGERSDPEFLELFIEEAKEEIDAIRANFARWKHNEHDSEAAQTLRRAYHTLKGSGRMVGAQLIGEFAWSVENLLNRVIDGTVENSEHVIALMENAASALPELVEQLEVGTDPDADIDGLMTTAWRLAEGEAAPAETGAGEQVAVETADDTAAAEEAAAGPGPEAEPVIVLDSALLEIFAKETSSHIEVIRDYVAGSEDREPPYSLNEAVRRAVHTLHGSANMASVAEIVAIAEPLDHFVSECFNSGQRISRGAVKVLEEAAGAIEALTGCINRPGPLPDTRGVRGRIEALESEAAEPEVPTEGLEVGEFDMAESEDTGDTVITRMVEVTSQPPAPEQADVGAQEDAEQEPAAEPEPWPEPVTGTAAEQAGAGASLPADEQPAEPAMEHGEETAAGQTAPGPAFREAQFTETEVLSYDPEIAGIFADEARELLDAADLVLGTWRAGGDTGAALDDLRRQLHTLKGGARMAGIAAMGDLSHQLESLLERVDAADGQPSGTLPDLVQQCLDRLDQMRTQVTEGLPVEAADDLLFRIRDWSRAAAEPAEAAEPAQPVAEPGPGREAGAQPLAGSPAQAGEDARPQPSLASPPTGPVTETTPPAEVFVPPGAGPMREPQPAAAQAVSGPAEEARPERRERARVDAELLQRLLDNAGEISIFRSRLEQQMNAVGFNLAELSQTVTRLRDQLRKLEIETEAQIIFRHQGEESQNRGDFDPLELDRYSTIQQLSRSLAETTGDLMSIQELLDNLAKESENLLVQQSRVTTELQHGLMRTRMIPFDRNAQRLARVVRQTAAEAGKQASLYIEGGQGEMDRQMLERMMPALEHMLRNAVIHGIESPAQRKAAGKPETGRVTISLRREGAETVIDLGDDGRGLDLARIRHRAASSGMPEEEDDLSDEEIIQMVFRPGFSTASEVTQTAGRGVGLDVVANEVRRFGGSVQINSRPGEGTHFVVRLPFTLAVSQALLVRTGDETYALPLTTVEGVTRVPRSDLEQHMAALHPMLEYGGREYPLRYLGGLLGNPSVRTVEEHVAVPVVLVRAGERSAALICDDLLGGREIVVKSVGPQLAAIRGISGATVLGDGSTVLILDLGALIRAGAGGEGLEVAEEIDQRTFVLVVDDSITVRRVTQRLLERNGMRVMTAKDGVDAVTLLQENRPDVILLDIEMPRMDGYEVAAHVREEPRLQDIPIVMITSRVGLKHRARAIELGVNDYLGKPYQESQLLDAIEPLVRRSKAS